MNFRDPDNYGSIEYDPSNKIRPLSSLDSKITKPPSSSSSILTRRPFTAQPFVKRPNTAVELNKHYSHKSIYSNLSSNYAVKRKFVHFRSKSTVNFVKRPFSTYSVVRKPGESPIDMDELEGEIFVFIE